MSDITEITITSRDEWQEFAEVNGAGMGCDLTKERMDMTREQLAAEYVELIGYDPFEDDPEITEEEVAQTLAEYKIEAGI